MTANTISSLPAVTSPDARDLFLITDPTGVSKKMTLKQIADFVGAQPIGNPNLLPSLSSPSSVLKLFVNNISGDDDHDGLSPTTQFQDLQYALDVIPDTAQGTVIVQLQGVGPYPDFEVRNYRSARTLTIHVVGDNGTTVANITLGVGVAPPNPDDGTKKFVLDYDIGSYSIPFSNGSHWMEFDDGAFFFKGLLLDCANCASPKIRTAAAFAVDSLHAKVHPYVTVLEPPGASDFTHFPEYVAPYSLNQSVFVTGCIMGQNNQPTVRNVSLVGCICPQGLFDDGFTCQHNVHVQGEYVAIHGDGNSYFLQPTISGIFEGGTSNPNGLVNIMSRACFFSGILRCSEVSENPPVIFGAHSGGNPGPASGVELDFVDVEMPTPGWPILLTRGLMRIGNDGGVSLHNVTTFIKAERNSWLQVEGVEGHTSDICVKASLLTAVEGLSSFTGISPQMRNTTHVGQDFQLGSGGLHAFSDGGYPITDTTEFCIAKD